MTVFQKFLSAIPIIMLVGAAGCTGHRGAMQGAAGEAAGGKNDVIYTCACGPQCQCGTASTKPGKCACGEDLVAGHVLKVEGTEALVCQCGRDCTCQLDPKDPTRCGCGKPVKRVDLAGTGVDFCNCMGSCTCNYLSDRPGKCRCGMNLTKAE